MERDKHIETASGTLRYWEAGTPQGTPIILIPGLGGFLELWSKNVESLSKSFHVFAVEPIGFGHSDKPKLQYTLSQLECSIVEFMTEKNIPCAHLIGNSLGGAIALQVAGKHPEMVAKMVLTGSAGFGKKLTIFLRLPSIPFLGELLFRSRRAAIEKSLRLIVHDSHCITSKLVDAAFAISQIPRQKETVLNIIRNHINLFGIKKSVFKKEFAKLAKIQAATLLIVGEYDKVIPPTDSIKAEKHLPNAKLLVMKDCGHMPQLECPEQFNQAVSDFLQRF
jgi:pimeloyl-ACP methyl ester carboxylesterase